MSDFVVNDGPWRKILSAMSVLDRAYVKVGVLASSGSEESDGGGTITMVELAAIHEFGSPEAGIPERSFIRSTFANSGAWLPAFQAKLAKAVLQGTMPIERALGILGQKAAAEVRATIVEERVTPKLEDSAAGQRTIARKGSSVTLIDTGRLNQSVSHEVVIE